VTDLSRLSRNISDFCDLYKDLGKYKANFLSIKEQFDTSTPIGEMMVFNMVNLAQFERKQTSERISMNFHSRAMRGLVNGGSPLLGYDRDPSNPGKRIVNEDEAELVKKIFRMYDEGQSQNAIADQLTKDCEKRKDLGSKKYRHIKDGRWTLNAIQNILKIMPTLENVK
jgi:site-specific DNA recombinase